MADDPLAPPPSARGSAEDLAGTLHVHLGKWPRLLVVGDPVGEDRADELILRCAQWGHLHANDRAWVRAVAHVVGLELDPRHGFPRWESCERVRERLGGVPGLEYLGLTGRIASAWIGGPRGWCGWDGRIGCANYNLGKWPTVEQVTDEWRAVAAAFPWLRLRAQLVPDEGEAERPAVEWRVGDGVAEVCEPAGKLTEPAEVPDVVVLSRLLLPGGERGVSMERLVAAVARLGG